MIRFSAIVSLFLSVSALAVDCELFVLRSVVDGSVVWAGNPEGVRERLNLETRNWYLYSDVLGMAVYFERPVVDIGSQSPSDVYARLEADSTPNDGTLDAIDWGGDWTTPISPFLPLGTVKYTDSTPSGIVASDGQGVKVVPLSENGSGQYVTSSPVVVDGSQGSYSVSYSPDVGWLVGFNPSWTGGISQSGSSSSLSSGSSSSVVVPVSGSSGSSTPSGSTVFGSPQTVNQINGDGDTYQVVAVPSQTVTLDNGSTLTMYDYSSILNAIGGNLSSGFSKVHDDFNTVNENLRKQLETSEDVSVAPDSSPSVDTSSADSEAASELANLSQSGSGWDFSFGMGSNPVGNFITGLIGNPPTSFGSQNRACSVSFDLPLVGTLQYEFLLSDWFPSAFRSCMLMILTFVFAIASAKAISGAFK